MQTNSKALIKCTLIMIETFSNCTGCSKGNDGGNTQNKQQTSQVINKVEEEAHCYVLQCKQVLYAADESLRAETSCIQLLNNLLRIAHKLFAYSKRPIVSFRIPKAPKSPCSTPGAVYLSIPQRDIKQLAILWKVQVSIICQRIKADCFDTLRHVDSLNGH